MKNRGFTLLELLAVIIILGVLGTVITISVMKSLRDTKENQCEEFVKNIEDSACTYVALKSKSIICNRDVCPDFKLGVLISEGFITEEIDPCTNKELNPNSTISITWTNNPAAENPGEKRCHYNGVREFSK